MERMKDIPGYLGFYAASKDGHIWSYNKNDFLSEIPTENNYLKVSLYKNKLRKTFYVHKLIALTYIPNPENLPTVDHIDRNKQNNDISNLRWATISEQNSNKDWSEKMQAAAEKGGKKVSRAVEMRDLVTHNLIRVFPSSRQASIELFGEPSKNSLINRCAHGNRNSAYGYYWTFVE